MLVRVLAVIGYLTSCLIGLCFSDPACTTEGGITLAGSSGRLQSPGYDMRIQDMICQWTVQAPKNSIIEFTVLDFDLDCEYSWWRGDRLFIYDGEKSLATHCGGRQPPHRFLSSTNEVRFLYKRFHNDNHPQGFHLTWSVLEACDPTSNGCSEHAFCWMREGVFDSCQCKTGFSGDGTSCAELSLNDRACTGSGVTLTGESGVITSPGFPQLHGLPRNIHCSWHILKPKNSHIELTFEFFSLKTAHTQLDHACDKGFLKLFVGGTMVDRYCTEGISPLVNAKYIYNNDILLKFRLPTPYSDGIQEGFKINWKISMDSVSAQACTDGISLTGRSGVINVPTFSGGDCTWSIVNESPIHHPDQDLNFPTMIHLTFFGYLGDTSNCENAAFSIYDEHRLVGSYNCRSFRPQNRIFRSNKVSLVLHGHGFNPEGFKIKWRILHECRTRGRCSKHANCGRELHPLFHTRKSYCACKEGFQGDGRRCQVMPAE